MNKIQNLFSTPKKAVITVISAIAIIFLLCVFGIFASGAIAQSQSIGKTAAENKALADAGIKEDDAVFSATEFKFEDGQYVYEVSFTGGSAKYEYVINASNGAIISANVEKDNSVNDRLSADSEQINYIKLSAAKQKALKNAGVIPAAATFTKAKLDIEDNFAVYEIEFFTSTKEYEYEINAKSGNIIEKSVEKITIRPSSPKRTSESSGSSSSQNSNSTSKYIGLSAAKQAALANAGVKSSAATFTKAKLDTDDGIAVYEIEFFTNSKEYEYEINAKSGKIIDKDIETIKPDYSNKNNSSYIGVDKAKFIAVTHAKIAEKSNILFKKAKLEKDNGVTTYEIEFACEGVEYEYVIEAHTGKILEYDSEREDAD